MSVDIFVYLQGQVFLQQHLHWWKQKEAAHLYVRIQAFETQF